VRGLTDAMRFLTVIPVPEPKVGYQFDFGTALPWFPVVGAGIGAAGGGLRVAFNSVLGPPPSAALALVGMTVLTGALHQDALADACDALGVRGDRERRLAVMRDSTLGAFGVLAIVLWALTAFAALDEFTSLHALRALVAAGATGRAAALLHGRLAPPARRDGLGAGLPVTTIRTGLALLLAAAISVAVVGPARGSLAVGIAAVVGALTAVFARRGVGGSTGDTLGATVAVAELAVILALLAAWR
jgi:adenosylcobinamide-GDP ribazoletransferase